MIKTMNTRKINEDDVDDENGESDLPYFSVQAKKSQEQSAMFEASAPL